MSAATKTRVAIVGSGAIGGFYGALLARAGFDVHFLLRSEYDAVRNNGLTIESQTLGDIVVKPVQAYDSVEQMPLCDWVLVGAKSCANTQLAGLINAVSAPDCKVVLLQNGLGVEDQLRPLLNTTSHLLAGLCYICAHRAAPGVVVHQALGAVNLAYHSGPESALEGLAIAELGAAMFCEAGLDSKAMKNLEQTRWQKLVWNIPYSGLSVILNADTRSMMADADARALIADLMQEVVEAGVALGCAMPDQYVEKLLAATDRMPEYLPSMYHDFALKRPAELQAIYASPLLAAQAVGQSMPKVRALYQSLRFIQKRAGVADE